MTTAPIRTSCQPIRTFGSILKIIAKSALDDRKQIEKIARLPHGGGKRQPGAHIFAERGEHRTEHERDGRAKSQSRTRSN